MPVGRLAIRTGIGVAVVAITLVLDGSPAAADNCRTMSDCFRNLETGLWIIAAVAVVAAGIIAFPYVVGPGLLGTGLAGVGAGGATVVIGGAVALPAAVPVLFGTSATAAGAASILHMAKATGRESASDIPSWAKGSRPQAGETPRSAAERILGERYGPGNYPRGPGSEFNKLKKFLERLRGRSS